MRLALFLLLLWPALAGDAPLYVRAVQDIQERYLDIDELDVGLAFDEAAEAAEAAVPWLIVDASGGVAHLRRGEDPPFAMVSIGVDGDGQAAIQDLPAALGRLESAIDRAGEPIPEGVDLPVELLRGVSRALDRHSVILSRSRLKRFDERIRGTLSGVGARIGRVDGELTIKAVFPVSPAMRAGLMRGDILVRVDGISTVGMSVADATRRIRGPVDSKLELVVRRSGGPGDEAHVLHLVRARVEIPNVDWTWRPSGVGVITIDHFSDHTTAMVQQALAEFEASSPDLRGLVLDLRGNAGGSMLQACLVVDQFVSDGTVIRTAGRGGRRVAGLVPEYRAAAEDDEPQVPLVVLVDRGSASASEIVAGALRARGRAVLVGDRTHGKGTVQKIFTLRPGDAQERVKLKMTVARYLVGGDTIVETGVGLEPDVWVRPVVFGRWSASLPQPVDGLSISYADERPGWREFTDEDVPAATGTLDAERQVPPPDRQGYLIYLAERLVLGAVGPDRDELLDAAGALARSEAIAEDARVVRTFAFRGLDWRRADEAGAVPTVDVDISVVDPPIAGDAVEVRAVVRNRGRAPLYRLRVELSTEDTGLPWGGLTLPIGYLPPGDEGMGSAVVRISPREPSRRDQVHVRVVADGVPAIDVPPVVLVVRGQPAPELSAQARLLPQGDHYLAQIDLENTGERVLTGVRAWLALPDDDSVELLDREALLPILAPGEPLRADIRLKVLHPDDPLALSLRVDAEVLGRVLKAPLSLPLSGGVDRVTRPQIKAQAPLAVAVGPLSIPVRVVDDSGLRSLVAWYHGEKIFWSRGSGRRLSAVLQLQVVEGTQPLILQAEDDQGAQRRETLMIRGIMDASAEAP